MNSESGMYVELHARSGFSFLEGASVPEELAGACAEFGMPAMAIMDRNGVYGAPRFHMAAKKAGIRAHIGSEITCTNGVCYPLLVETREGYRNLCRLVTRMKLRAKKGEGAVTLEETRRIRPRAHLHHAPSRRAPARHVRPRQRLRRAPAPLQSRRGGAATRPSWTARAGSASRWWPPTASLTPRPRSASCSTSSPASATT